MESCFLKNVIARLQDRLAELNAWEAQTAEDRAPVELDQTRIGRLSRVDALQGQAMATAQQERRQVERRRVEAAIARIEDGSYGECVRCGDEISEARLEADPANPLCVVCAGNG